MENTKQEQFSCLQPITNSSSMTNNDYDGGDAIIGAFAHYTYHASKGVLMILDLQGKKRDVNGKVKYMLTDPAFISRMGLTFGQTDMGAQAMNNFFRHHRCTQYCDPNWKRPTKDIVELSLPNPI